MTSRLVKGSPAAFTWSRRMKASAARIRAAGLRSEKKFFGPGGVFARSGHTKHLKNPLQSFSSLPIGSQFIFESEHSHPMWQNAKGPWIKTGPLRYEHIWNRGLEIKVGNKSTAVYPVSVSETGTIKLNSLKITPRPEPHFTSWQMLIDYLKHEGWKPRGKKGVGAFGRHVGGLYQVLQLEARAWRVLHSHSGQSPVLSLGTYQTLDRALIAANRQANDFLRATAPKRNPINIAGNPPKRIRSTVAGVMYNKVWEIQAEKTGDNHKGFWYHPFNGKSDVQMLALDNGDLLIHSQAGNKLWRED